MKTDLQEYTVEQVVDGFVYNELEGKGLFGLAGTLVIQPEYLISAGCTTTGWARAISYARAPT